MKKTEQCEALRKAAQQILEALEGIGFVSDYWNEKVTSLREALAEQAEQEPVASVRWGRYKECEWTATERLHELLGRFREGQTPLQLYAAPIEPVKQEPVACGCGATAYCLIRHTNLPEHNFTPICLSCLQEHEQNAQEVNEHEMHNFGGAYGLVTWETKPLYAASVRTKNLTDDEIDEIESEILMGGGEYIDVIRAVIAKFKEKNNVK